MTFPASNCFALTFRDALNATQLAIDLDLETHKIALFLDAVSGPNVDTDTAYGVSPWNANESSGTGYTAGGIALTGTTFVSTSGVCAFDANDSSWTTVTVTARGDLVYADALAGNNALVCHNFGADFTATAGTFLITHNAAGLFTANWSPN